MKPPKYTGPKKNHSAIWIGEYGYVSGVVYSDERIRILTSLGQWIWAYSRDDKWDRSTPCWYGSYTHLSAIRRMQHYDGSNLRKTIFLGYVKDTE